MILLSYFEISSWRYDSLIGFGGAVPVLLLFLLLNRKLFSWKGIVVLVLFLYPLSVATGIAADLCGLRGMKSAYVAGFIAPAIYGLSVSIIFRFTPVSFLRYFRIGMDRTKIDPGLLDAPLDMND